MTVLVHRTMSLDGFVAGPDHDMTWMSGYGAPRDGVEIMQATGAILAGAGTATFVDTPSGKPYGGSWSGPVFVLTHHPGSVPDVTYLSGDIREAVAVAVEAAGDKRLEVFGTNVTEQCLSEGLVDEIIVHIVPVLLGAGTPLNARCRVELEFVSSVQTGPITSLTYRVRGTG